MMYIRIKVILDFFLAAIILILSIPVLLPITILLFFHFDGKPIFKQKRLGYQNKEFFIYKLKTMRDIYDETGTALPDKDRITKIGAIIRKLSLDELAQVINIFKQEMSFIGPRPLSVKNLPYYTKRELLRHEVRPGITGLAQVNGRNNLAWDDRLELDVQYFENISFILDFKILLKTIKNVLIQKDISITPQIPSLMKSRSRKL